MNSEDEKLVEDFLAGHDASFEKLVKKYLSSVYNFLYYFIRDKDSLDDVVQESFLKAWKNIRRFDRKNKFKTWLFVIAKNTALDFLKKKKTVPFSFFEDDEGYNKLENIGDEKIIPDEILERKNIAKEMEEKLKLLPEKYQAVLNLHYKEDFSLLEISQILKKPYGTVKSWHVRALERMKKNLQ